MSIIDHSIIAFYKHQNIFTNYSSVESLFVIQGKDQGYRFELLHDIISIGRDPNNLIQLHDGEISRKHAEIHRDENVRTLIDLNSSNGLFINGNRIQEQKLQNGDQIQIGRTLLLYTCSNNNESGLTGAAPVVFQTEKNRSGLARIVHSLSQEEGRRLFQTATEKSQESAWLAKAKAHLNLMYHTTLVVSQTLDIDRLLHRIMDLIFEWVQVDRGCIMLYDLEDNSLIPKVSRARNQDQTTTRLDNIDRLSISQTILDYVLRRKEGVLTSDAQTDQRWEPTASIFQMGIREAICVPMQGRYGLVGVIYIDTSRTPQEVLAEDLANSSKEKQQNGFAGNEEITFSNDVDKVNHIPLDQSTPQRSELDEKESSENLQGDQASPKMIKNDRKLTADHLKLMVAIGHQAALAVEDTQYYLGMVQAERLAAVGQTVAVLSHHIKNILQGIRGGSYFIDLGLKEHDEVLVRKGWGIVEKNQTKISDLVLDMLTFSKERMPIWDEADINDVVSDVVELMTGRSQDLEIILKWFPEPNIPRFFFDAEQIHRAVTNLVTNAIDAARERFDEEYESKIKRPTELKSNKITNGHNVDSMRFPNTQPSYDSNLLNDPSAWNETQNSNKVQNQKNSRMSTESRNVVGLQNPDFVRKATNFPEEESKKSQNEEILERGRVEIQTIYHPRFSTVSIFVDDNGPGVSPELKDVLFRPFLSKNKSSGTGLGLAVTNKIVHEHKGKVEIFESPLGGARFAIELPILLKKPANETE
ncbi:MAG: FHA domain-containing protein [Planctomycetia bacterium]|nr:FHA domain-containing protein [Planctomycetia bacterium]